MEITPTENTILPMLLHGVPLGAIGRKLHHSDVKVRSIRDSLITKGMIEKSGKAKYRLLVTSYTVAEAVPVFAEGPAPPIQTTFDVSRELEKEIRVRYERMPRRQIAEELGIPKAQLNMMLIQLRLGG